VRTGVALDRSGGDKTVATRPSLQLVGVTSHVFIDRPFCPEPPRIRLLAAGEGNITVTRAIEAATRPPLCTRSGGDETVAARSSPKLVGLTSLSLQLTGVTTRLPLSASRVVTKRSPLDNSCHSTEPAAGCGDTTVTSVDGGGNTATCTCEPVVTKQSHLDRSGGDKTVATRPSPRLVGVTLLSLQPTGVANGQCVRVGGDKKGCSSTAPHLVGVALMSPQVTERQQGHLVVQQVVWNKPVAPRFRPQSVGIETSACHTCR